MDRQTHAFRFTCAHCGDVHNGIPAFHAARPAQYAEVPVDKRAADVFLTSDSCVIADRFFFVRGCLDIPVIGTTEVLQWGVWVSLSETSFFAWQAAYTATKRAHLGPYFGWLSTDLAPYGVTRHLPTTVVLRDDGLRPSVTVADVDHPLAKQQRDGISMHELARLIHAFDDA